jgi:ferredoxin
VTRTDGTPGVVQAATVLRVDPVSCQGIGMCAHIAPHLIGVDAWGYPQLARDPLRGAQVRSATAAVAACPRRALFLQT